MANRTTRNDIGSQRTPHGDIVVIVLPLWVAMEVAICCSASLLLEAWRERKRSKIQREIQRKIEAVKSNHPNPKSCPPFLQQRGLDSLSVLNAHELNLVEDVVDPDTMKMGFGDIGGLHATKTEIWQLCVLPLKRPDLFAGKSLIQPPKGILLHGKPGTGKTMLAKALAKEASVAFIEVKTSRIFDSHVGETNKNIAAIFSLARKIAPSIIFIDEIDLFLSSRAVPEQAWMSQARSEFLTAVDGVTCQNQGVMLLCATNNLHNIDAAVLRRMPRKYEIPLPDEAGRLEILKYITEDQGLGDDIIAFLPRLAEQTNGFSGADLKELCRIAAMQPIHKATIDISNIAVSRAARTASSNIDEPSPSIVKLDDEESEDMSLRSSIRPNTVEDFLLALEQTKPIESINNTQY